MEPQELKITIDKKTLDVKIETSGFQGDSCLGDGQAMGDALGEQEGEPTLKAEAYQVDVTTTNTVIL